MKSFSKESRNLRRQRAADRFKILPFLQWALANKLGGHVDNHKAAYAAYKARKEIEAQSLGLRDL